MVQAVARIALPDDADAEALAADPLPPGGDLLRLRREIGHGGRDAVDRACRRPRGRLSSGIWKSKLPTCAHPVEPFDRRRAASGRAATAPAAPAPSPLPRARAGSTRKRANWMVSPMPCSVKTRIVLPASASPVQRGACFSTASCLPVEGAGAEFVGLPAAREIAGAEIVVATAPGGSARRRDSGGPPPPPAAIASPRRPSRHSAAALHDLRLAAAEPAPEQIFGKVEGLRRAVELDQDLAAHDRRVAVVRPRGEDAVDAGQRLVEAPERDERRHPPERRLAAAGLQAAAPRSKSLSAASWSSRAMCT